MAISKMSREANGFSNEIEDTSFFDFGDPEIITVEISDGKYLSLREPVAEELEEISKITSEKDITEVNAILRMICILHYPSEGGKKLTLKDAKRLRPKQLKKLGEAINELISGGEEQEDMKS